MITKVTNVVLLVIFCSAGMVAQENVFLSRAYWKTNPSVNDIKKNIASGNDPSVMNRNAFDATVYAILEKVNDESIKYLLSLDGNSVEKRTHDSRTYIFWAAYAGKTGVMKHLLDKGANITDVRDSHGNTPLTFAASTGQKDPQVYELFEEYGVILNQEVNEDGLNVMFLIAPYLETEAELAFLQSKGFNIMDLDPKGNSLFNHAARKGDVSFLKLLVAKEVDPLIVNKDGGNAVLYASMGARGTTYSIETFKYLEGLGIAVNIVGDSGRNPLHAIAYKSKDIDLFNYFIRKGVQVDLQDNGGNTPFMNAANSNTLAVVKLLATHVKDIDVKDKNGRTALAMAVHRNEPEVVEFLISKGGDVMVKDNEGNSLAYYLLNTFKGDTSEIFDAKLTLLQSKGLSLLKTQNAGNTLLHIATERGELAALKRLRAFKIDLDTKNDDGYTALHIAAMKAENDTILKYLLSEGADPSVKTSFEESVYDLASENELLAKNSVQLNFLK